MAENLSESEPEDLPEAQVRIFIIKKNIYPAIIGVTIKLPTYFLLIIFDKIIGRKVDRKYNSKCNFDYPNCQGRCKKFG